MKERYTAVILSAGSGTRMKSAVPKQYLELGGDPVICHSLRAFEESPVDSIVLVADDADFCREQIVERCGFHKVSAIVAGGEERYLSVYNGLKACSDADYVLIHDGARPLVQAEDIRRSMECVLKEKACVLATPVKDTIRMVEGGYAAGTPDRNTLWAMQTPQSFSYPLLMEAYDRLFARLQAGEALAVTDDAMIVECTCDQKIRILSGSPQNIKITTPEDLAIAEMFLQKIKNSIDTRGD